MDRLVRRAIAAIIDKMAQVERWRDAWMAQATPIDHLAFVALFVTAMVILAR